MDFSGLPPATARLAVELLLADVNAIMNGMAQSEDGYAAFEATRTEFQNILPLLQDQVLTMNILRTDHNDRVVFERLIREEIQAEEDHSFACELDHSAPGQNERPTPEGPIESRNGWSSNDNCRLLNSVLESALTADQTSTMLDKFGFTSSTDDHNGLYETVDNHMLRNAESSTRQLSKGKGRAKDAAFGNEHLTHAFCSACMEHCARFDVLELGCNREEDATRHAYCRSCLIDLFESSLTDTTLFPPRCCGVRIPISACVELCPSELVRRYEDKQVELASPNPIYCSNRYCAQFIKPENTTADVAICTSCQAETCTICRSPRHNGLCPVDPTVQMLMNVAGEKRWQRCPKCRTMIELITGCYHMRCLCGGQFCYLCAKPWKTCLCSQWDERHLLSDAQTIDAPGNRIAMPEEEEVLEADPIIDIVDALQLRLTTVAGGSAFVNDEEAPGVKSDSPFGTCHHRWERAYGEHSELKACAVCQNHLKFVNACILCKTNVCNRCLLNRL